MAALDEFVGNVTHALASRGLWNNATFIFTTDNGGNLHGGGNNWPLRSGKFSLWEGGIRGQAFIAGAGISSARAGTNATGLFSAADWWATVVRLGHGGSRADTAAIVRNTAGVLSDSIDQLDMINGGVNSVRDMLAISVSLKQSKGKSALRMGHFKLLVGFPGQSTKTGCVGGCWCPLPDPTTGEQKCVPPDGVMALFRPPSVSCAAAMAATGCGAEASPKTCAECAHQPMWNHSLVKAGCQLKDPKHWCNNHCAGCYPGPPPPAPPPAPSSLPCAERPCLFNVTADPLELVDLAGNPMYKSVVAMMLTHLTVLRENATTSVFPGGHDEAGACRSLKQTGAWAPWVPGPPL